MKSYEPYRVYRIGSIVFDTERRILFTAGSGERRLEGIYFTGWSCRKNESIVDAVIREMREETGLTVLNPKLCGVKQFPVEKGRYIVFLFHATDFYGEVVSSDEGEMHWINREYLSSVNTVSDFSELLQVILDDKLNEFQYVVKDNEWKVVIK